MTVFLAVTDVPLPFGTVGKIQPKKTQQVIEIIGRGSWIRTNDLQYPKLPRYQAALYPDLCWECVDTRLNRGHQGARIRLSAC